MKFKYLKVSGQLLWGENDLTKEMLIMVENRHYDTIINLEDQTYYDAEKNAWVEIEGTK